MQAKVTFFLLEKVRKSKMWKNKFILNIFGLFLLVVFVFFGSRMEGLAEINSENQLTSNQVNEIMLKFKDDKEIYTIKFASSTNLNEVCKNYQLNANVEFAEPNYLYKAAILSSDTFSNNQWYLKKIKAPDAWDVIHDSPEIVIAVIDSGVQISHPDLAENIWSNKGEISGNGKDDDNNGFIDDVNGWDFVNNVANPEPKFSYGYTLNGVMHGTIIAGVIGASGNNATGVSGITWRTKIMPLKVLDDKGEGDTRNVIRAIDYAIRNKVNIINLSFVGTGYSHALELAIKRAYDAGILIVAAAGNEQGEESGYNLDDNPMYPVCYDGYNGENMVIGVAATDGLDQKAVFSGYGSKCIDISAPGVSIFSTAVYAPDRFLNQSPFDKKYDGYWSGTSMAVPMVSGALALVETINPGLSRKEISDIILNYSDNIAKLNRGYYGKLGKGRLNVFRAVRQAQLRLSNQSINVIATLASGNKNDGLVVADEQGKIAANFIPYNNFRGGVNLASGDVDGDGKDEIITAPAASGEPRVKIFDREGKLLSQFLVLKNNFRGGVNLASGDVDGDGKDEIITAPAKNEIAQVKIFSNKGVEKSKFIAYNNFRGGVNLASGDVDGDGKDEIITGVGAGGGPQVKVFNGQGNLQAQFFAYDKKFRGGVKVAVADVDGGARSRKSEIITAPGEGGGPQVIIFNNFAQKIGQFFAYDKKFRGGVNLSAGDLNHDGLDEIVTGAGRGGSPHIRAFKPDGTLLYSFYAFNKDYNVGVNVGVIKY